MLELITGGSSALHTSATVASTRRAVNFRMALLKNSQEWQRLNSSAWFFCATFDKGNRGRFTYVLDQQGRLPGAVFDVNPASPD
jgi:hypothetical protein